MNDAVMDGIMESLNAAGDAISALTAGQQHASEALNNIQEALEGQVEVNRQLMAGQIAHSTLITALWAHILLEMDDVDNRGDEFKAWLMRNCELASGSEIEVDAFEQVMELADEIVRTIRSGEHYH